MTDAIDIEKQYQKKNDREHVLLRPSMYVGSTEREEISSWVLAAAASKEEELRFEKKQIVYTPGLYKIFDEILVNAIDHTKREKSDVTTIKVSIDKEHGIISVYNDGNGIPIHLHREYNVYVPELVFGHCKSSTNFNDDEKRLVGGLNGLGAKLANIFSTEFYITTVDNEQNLIYTQLFTNNMEIINPPEIKKYAKTSKPYTEITFKPDLSRFNMTKIDDDMYNMFVKRTYDAAACTDKKVSVYFN